MRDDLHYNQVIAPFMAGNPAVFHCEGLLVLDALRLASAELFKVHAYESRTLPAETISACLL